jgi:hypothetical protein
MPKAPNLSCCAREHRFDRRTSAWRARLRLASERVESRRAKDETRSFVIWHSSFIRHSVFTHHSAVAFGAILNDLMHELFGPKERSMDAPKPRMTPPPGERLLRFVGDYVRFELQAPPESAPNARAFLRTNLGKESTFREEIIATYAGRRPLSVAFWRDVPFDQTGPNQWSIEMPLVEPGFFPPKKRLDSTARVDHP